MITTKGLSINNVSVRGGGGVSQILTLANKVAGGGVSQILALTNGKEIQQNFII